MSNQQHINVSSEIGTLKAVLLHRPGKELERLTPQYLDELLFDDIPWPRQMQKEHGQFAAVMEDRGIQVYYYEEMLGTCLDMPGVKEAFVKDLVQSSDRGNSEIERILIEYLTTKSDGEIIEAAISGLYKEDVPVACKELHLVDYVERKFPFYINPIPNLYFTRDPGTVIGCGLAINRMKTGARSRETMFLDYLYRFHPLFGQGKLPLWYHFNESHSLEGGDILVLSDKVVAVGCSERTSPRGIEVFAENLLRNSDYERVLAIEIPLTRAYMHLDTVFTMVNYDQFAIYPGVEKGLTAYSLTLEGRHLEVTQEESLKKALQTALKLPAVQLIQSGGGNAVTAAREQWNDSTNTLAIAPGVIITYNRNEVSNEIYRKNQIQVIEIEGSELVRGRGGPRCMSMPLIRENH